MENDDRCLDSPALCNKHGNPNPILGDGPLQKGDRRKEVTKKLQRMLKELDYDLGNTGPDKDGVDGTFGVRTHVAVIDFQQEKVHKYWEGKTLKNDGLVGPQTSDALNREMVGVWYDFYQTDEKLTEGKKIITVTSKYLSDTGLSLEDLKGEEEIDVIVKGEVKKIEYGIDLTKTDERWIPDACNERVKYTSRLYALLKGKWVFPPPRKKTITFQLKDVSKEPGICMNYPQNGNENPDLFFPDDDDNKDFDLEDDDTSSADCPTAILVANDNPAHDHHHLKATTKDAVNEATVVVRCEDYGAFGTLEASARNCKTLLPREEHADVSGQLGPNDVKMPHDEDGNNIADAAPQDAGGAPADTDDDATPVGDPAYPGDGFTNYEEYRGFIIGGGGSAKKHIRTDITKKDLFIYVEHAELRAHLGYYGQTGIRVHVLRDPLLFNGTASRVVNFNRNNATKEEQHGLWLLKAPPDGGSRGVTYWITRPPRKPGNCEKIEIMVETINNEGIANMLKRVIAHELGHACGLAHHGDVNPILHNCGGKARVNRNGFETSGDVMCVMRYTNVARYWCHGNPHHRHETERPAVVGNTYCSSPDGTGINAPGAILYFFRRGHFRNDATVGNCKSHIRVRDRD